MSDTPLRVPSLLKFALVCSIVATMQIAPTLARAGYVVNSLSSQNVSFALWNTNGGSFGAPVWSTDPNYPNMLISAGPLAAGSPAGAFPTSPFPGLASVNTQGNVFNLPGNTASFSNSNSSNPALLAPSTYGSSTVYAAVSSSLASKGSGVNNVIGTSFNAGTFLNSGTGMLPGTTAITYSHIHGSFTYSGATLNAQHVGAILSASGYVSPGGFVELAEVGTIMVGGTTFNFSMIGAGAADNSGNFSQLSNGPITFNNLGGGDFTVSGSYAATGTVSVTSGTNVVIDSYLTMIADPGSGVMLNTNGFTNNDLPEIMAGFGGPQGVPEPAAVIQLGTGLMLATGFVAFRRRNRRRRDISSGTPFSRKTVVGLFILCLGLLGSGKSDAASVVIDGLGPFPAAQASSFYTSSSSINQANNTYDFTGTYKSAGTLPTLGSPDIFTVVFTESPGSTQSEVTRLTISALPSNMVNSHRNVEVQIHYEGTVSTPISPGTGVYFIPAPAGYFDVAEFLTKKVSNPSVLNNLSVQVMSLPPVPEPASILTAGIGLVSVGLWGVFRRRKGQS